MLKTISKKFYRFKTSRNYLKFIKLFHIIFGEKFNKKIPIPNTIALNIQIKILSILLIKKYQKIY